MFWKCVSGKIIKIKIDPTKALTPPSLEGTERRIAYANRKYHSGTIWGGVSMGLAGMKLSASPNKVG